MFLLELYALSTYSKSTDVVIVISLCTSHPQLLFAELVD